MLSNDRGDFGFMEAMVAMMAVIVVLTAYLGVAASTVTVMIDPTEGVDVTHLTGTVEDGVFVPSYGDYIENYAISRGLTGISVSVTVPGGFCEVPEPMVVGEMDGERWSRTITSMIDAGDGRTIVAVFEVTACARTRTGSLP